MTEEPPASRRAALGLRGDLHRERERGDLPLHPRPDLRGDDRPRARRGVGEPVLSRPPPPGAVPLRRERDRRLRRREDRCGERLRHRARDRRAPAPQPAAVGGGPPLPPRGRRGRARTSSWRTTPSGTVAVLPILPDGRLGAPSDVQVHSGSGPNESRQEGPHAHGLALDAAGGFAFAADLGRRPGLRLPLRPRRRHPGPGRAVGGARARLRPPARRLPPVGPVPLRDQRARSRRCPSSRTPRATGGGRPRRPSPPCPTASRARARPRSCSLSPDGRFLYGSNRGHDSLAVFAVDSATGRLSPAGHVPVGGRTPRHFTVDASGRWLLAANQGSDNVVVLRRDPDTGLASPVGEPVASVEAGLPAAGPGRALTPAAFPRLRRTAAILLDCRRVCPGHPARVGSRRRPPHRRPRRHRAREEEERVGGPRHRRGPHLHPLRPERRGGGVALEAARQRAGSSRCPSSGVDRPGRRRLPRPGPGQAPLPRPHHRGRGDHRVPPRRGLHRRPRRDRPRPRGGGLRRPRLQAAPARPRGPARLRRHRGGGQAPRGDLHRPAAPAPRGDRPLGGDRALLAVAPRHPDRRALAHRLRGHPRPGPASGARR